MVYRFRVLSLVAVVVILCLFHVSVVKARNYQVLALSWLSRDGHPLLNEDFASSFMAIPIAIHHFNTRNGSILPFLSENDQLNNCDAKLDLINGTLIDDEGMSTVAMSTFVHTLVAETPIDMIHGPSRSEAAQTVAIAAGTLRIPMISFTPSAAFLSNQEVYPTLYQIVPGDDKFAVVAAELLRNYKYHVVGFMHANDASGVSLRDSLVKACSLMNIRVRSVSFDSTKRGAELESNVRNAFKLLVKEKLNVILRVTRNVEQEVSIAKAAVEEQWIQGKLHIGRLPSLSVESLLDSASVSSNGTHYLKSLLKGSLTLFASYDWTNSNFGRLKNAWPNFDPDFVNAHLPNGTTSKGDSYKIPKDHFLKRNMPRSFAAAYDSIIALGLAACGPDKENLNSNMKQVQFMGTTGFIRAHQEVSIDSYQYNKFVLESLDVESSSSSSVSSSSKFFGKQVGEFVDGNWTIRFHGIVYSDGTNQVPKDREPPKHVIDTLPFGAKVLGWCESGVTILCCLWAVSHLIRNGRKFSPPNQQPSAILFWMMIFGSILLALSLIPLTLETNGGCMAYLWLLSLGFGMVVGSLICKALYVLVLWRTDAAGLFKTAFRNEQATMIGQKYVQTSTPTSSSRSPMTSTLTIMTMNNDETAQQADDVSTVLGVSSNVHKPIKCLKVKIFGPLMVIVMAIVGLMTSWQIIQPNVRRTVVQYQDMDGNPLFSMAQCTSAMSALSHSFAVGLIVILGTIVLLAFVLALCARNAPKVLAYDIKATLVASTCILQVFSIAVPSLAAAWTTSLGHFLVNSSVSFLVCLIVIFTMIVPKVLNWKLISLTLPIKPIQSNSNLMLNPSQTMMTESINGHASEQHLKSHRANQSTSLLRTTKPRTTKYKSNVVVQFDFDPSQYDSSPRAQQNSQEKAGSLSVIQDAQRADSKLEQAAFAATVTSHLNGPVSSPSVRQPVSSNASSPSRLQMTRAGINGLDNLDVFISSKRRLPAFVDPNELLMHATTAPVSSTTAASGLRQHPFPILHGTADSTSRLACETPDVHILNRVGAETVPSCTINQHEEENGLENA